MTGLRDFLDSELSKGLPKFTPWIPDNHTGKKIETLISPLETTLGRLTNIFNAFNINTFNGDDLSLLGTNLINIGNSIEKSKGTINRTDNSVSDEWLKNILSHNFEKELAIFKSEAKTILEILKLTQSNTCAELKEYGEKLLSIGNKMRLCESFIYGGRVV